MNNKRERENHIEDTQWNIRSPQTFEDLIMWETIPDENSYSSMMYWKSCYRLTLGVIKDGHAFEGTNNPLSKIYDLYHRIEGYRITNRSVNTRYPLTDGFDLFSIDTICFLCQCHVMVILYAIDGEKFSLGFLPQLSDYRDLVSQELLMIHPSDRTVLKYTQMDVEMSVYRICQMWSNVEYSPSLERYINGLMWRVADFIINVYPDFSDTTEDGHHKQGDVNIPTKEFFSHISVSLISLKTPFYIEKTLVRGGVISVCGMKSFEGKSVDKFYEGIYGVLKENIKFWNADSTRKIIKNMVYFLYLRPGEESRYARSNGGTYIKDPAEILDAMRTEFQNYTVYMRIVDIESNLPKSIEQSVPFFSRDERNGMITATKSATVFKLFDNLCNRDCLSKGGGKPFQWVANCVILEREFSNHHQSLSKITYPLIIQMAGEFNLLYQGFLYKTMSAEMALSFWVMIIVYRCGSEVWVRGEKYDMSGIHNKISQEMLDRKIKKKKDTEEICRALQEMTEDIEMT